MVCLDPIHVVLLTNTDGTCPPLVKIRLSGLGVESELSLRCEIIECDPHELPTKFPEVIYRLPLPLKLSAGNMF